MHYRHIKRICRGEASLSFSNILDIVRDSHIGIRRDLYDGDLALSMAGIIELANHIYDIVYIPRYYQRFEQHSWWHHHINIQQNNPVYWIRFNNEDVIYMIGIRFDDIMRVILEHKQHVKTVFGIPIVELFRLYIRHLKWILKHEGIKYTISDFNGIRNINGCNRPEIVYSTMSRIFINFTKQKSKWQMK